MIIKKITILGTGNVAYNLGKLFLQHGFTIVQVYGRNLQAANALAKILKSQATNNLATLNINTHLFLICVADDAVPNIITAMPKTNIPVVHTAGSVPMLALKKASQHIGVLYPLQSLKKEAKTLPEIPFLITANNTELEKALLSIAKKIKCKAQISTCNSRKGMHLAAVFASNFTNYMYYCAEQLCKKNELPFPLLHPLIFNSALRLQYNDPSVLQTGPAVRGDANTLAAHIKMLEKNKDLKDIYTSLSQHIFDNLHH